MNKPFNATCAGESGVNLKKRCGSLCGAQRYIRAFCFDLVGQHCGKTLPSLLSFLAIVVILFNFPFLSGLLWLCPDLVKDKHEDTECGLFSTKSHSSSFLLVQHEALMLSPVHKAVNPAIDCPIYLYELDYNGIW